MRRAGLRVRLQQSGAARADHAGPVQRQGTEPPRGGAQPRHADRAEARDGQTDQRSVSVFAGRRVRSCEPVRRISKTGGLAPGDVVIAILGATGYIGRSLAKEIVRANVGPLWLFARDPAKLADGVWPSSVRVQSLDTFDTSHFTLVINAIGAGDPARIRDLGASLVAVSDAWDKRILGTMNER